MVFSVNVVKLNRDNVFTYLLLDVSVMVYIICQLSINSNNICALMRNLIHNTQQMDRY